MEGLAPTNRTPHYLSVPLTDMLRPNFQDGSKISLPVNNYTPFANFQYVEGVPAGNEGGYSVSKLQILDTLIAHLVHTRDRQVVNRLPEDLGALTDKQVDTLIDDLAHRLQVASNASVPGLPIAIGETFGMAASQTGAALSMLA